MLKAEMISKKARLRPPTLKTSSEAVAKAKKSELKLFQIFSNLFMAGYEEAKDLTLLTSNSITHILNLAGPSKCPNNYQSIHYFSMKMPDSSNVNILFFMYFAMEFIINSTKNNGKVLIHCVKGKSRAAAVVICYLILLGYSEEEAYAYVSFCNSNIDPNFGFVCQLKEL